MHEHSRYTVLEKIAQGDYAVIYKGRDQELGRDVAIKQIHEQYLHDQQQLERYWQEARLIAQLQYPRIMGIYDIVRDWGWLILELMKGSVPQFLNGKAMDLKDLRIMLTSMTHALKFLAENGIIHGDVKPNNILVDQNRLFKLGDFGIARRLAGDDGSVVKGTTKFMAPEVVSDQFGPVGPQSDLYSLGFTAYALMCGDQFESLFPGLNAFGRDPQIAWMMWHSAPDRRLPEIKRVFQNVPDDLAHVIERLCEKDPTKRYQHAEEVLADLRENTSVVVPGADKPEAKPDDEAKQARNRRRLVIAAVVASLVMSVGIAFIPPPNENEAPIAEGEQFREPSVGVLNRVDEVNHRLVVDDAGEGSGAVSFDTVRDIALFNGNQQIDFKDLRKGDRIEVVKKTRPDGTLIRKDFKVTRSTETSLSGTLSKILPTSSKISITLKDSPQNTAEVFVPNNSPILLNGKPQLDGGRQVTIADLKLGDAMDVEFAPPHDDQQDLVAVSVRALRSMRASGTLVKVDSDAGAITVKVGSRETTLTATPDCRVTVNGATTDGEGRPFTLAALSAGENVDLVYDALVHSIATARTVVIDGLVEAVDVQGAKLRVAVADKPSTTLNIPDDCQIEVEGDRQGPIELTALRPGDEVVVTADESGARASHIQARLAQDGRAWVLAITYQRYRDQRLAELPTSRADAEMLTELLQRNYRVVPEQVRVMVDATGAELTEAIPDFLSKFSAADQLIVLFNGNAYVGDDGVPYLAPSDFDLSSPGETGVELAWLLGELHGADATERILLFDGYHEGVGQDRRWQPSSAAMVKTLRGTIAPGQRPVRIIASCNDGESNLTVADGNHSLFAESCSQGFRGAADRNRDDRVTAMELFDFLRDAMPQSASQERRGQTPAMSDWSPPPAISKEGRLALLDLLEYLARRDPLRGRFSVELAEAKALVPDQPYPQLINGIALFKERQLSRAKEQLEQVVRQYPESMVANHALAWLLVRENDDDDVLAGLARLNAAVTNLDDPNTEYAKELFDLSGRLTAYAVFSAGAVEESKLQELPLTQAVGAHGDPAKQLFLQPYRKISSELVDRKKQIDQAIKDGNVAEATRLKLKQNNLVYYAEFNFDVAKQQLQRELAE